MSLVIRADATTQIGTGHVMRCMALAQAWQDRGSQVTFLSHCESDSLYRRITDEGFSFISIQRSHPDPSDLYMTLESLSAMSSELSSDIWLVLDGYHFTPQYQKAIRNGGKRLLVIDDYNHLPHYHADILINQNIGASSISYICDPDTIRLLDCKYALLRREFLKHKDRSREISKKAKKVLVTLGGADPENVTLKVIQGLNQLNDKGIEVKIVVGPSNPNIQSLWKELSLSTFSFELLTSTNEMPDLMAWADIAVSGGGTTCWELAFMGVPTLVITIAENQKAVGLGLQSAGAAIDLGESDTIDIANFAMILNELLFDFARRDEISINAMRLVDGKGTNRLMSFFK
ncbi:MAG: UDP-2,4-diacetamido-2,4,6-trideoxy-beta-L-altropyranose hydrolase [Deltaproteobacteria bacterium]|nr:UDP-2,4-diacetamido-2,4,6-trideoxy-beta-L-altropyranose hydrolase [Deltaproteobacteria bacterium]